MPMHNQQVQHEAQVFHGTDAHAADPAGILAETPTFTESTA